jgi:thiol-disulfide isomerase/thioredoxin
MTLRRVVAVAIGLGLIAANPTATVKLQESGPAAKVGGMAPSFGGWDLSGRNVLASDKLRKTPTPAPLLVTFGASFCAPCKQGLPRLAALQRKHAGVFRLVLIDVEADAQKAQEFKAAAGLDPETPAILDKFNVIAKTYGVNQETDSGGKENLPRTFLINAKGRIVAIYGMEGPDLESVIETDLKEALAQAAEGAPAPK